jgi:uncharacterized protein
VDRVFLDANVLFSASFRGKCGLLQLWQLANVELITSYYAWDEARRNIDELAHIERLNHLTIRVELPVWVVDQLPAGISIDEKDVPILLDAINSRATHLLTGDKQHFGEFFGRRILGTLIQPPAEYIARRFASGSSRLTAP